MNIPLSEYPRPQMTRDSYMCLNGIWDLTFLSDGETAKTYQIMVPYSPECAYSGVCRTLQSHETMRYSRHVRFDGNLGEDEVLLLHFGAVDYRAQVFVDKNLVCEHIGGYLPFTVKVSEAEFDIDVCVQDPGDDKEISRGKQSSNPGGIWYPKTSGIWQTVWLEKVPVDHIESISVTPDMTGFHITVNTTDKSHGSDNTARVEILGQSVEVSANVKHRIDIKDPQLWSPENPYLYHFNINYKKDRVSSYVGLRTFGIRDKVLTLNGKPYFHHGVLDQGYWKDGYYTPRSDQDFVDDILRMKAMGFNTMRKHIKIEPLRWYHHCDSLGMLVWQDMVSGGGEYRPMTIMAPLVIGSRLKDDRYDRFARTDTHEREVWEEEAYGTVRHLHNCTCIAMWVPFNEGWGQFDSRRITDNIRTLDNSRTIDHASGWQDQGAGDFKSLHVYFRPYRFRRDKLGRAVILSEFGGYGMDTNTTGRKAFTYRRYRTREALTKAVIRLYDTQIVPAKKKGLAASIYTQVSDVEQEVNGLLTYDRAKTKVNAEEMKEMSGRLLSGSQLSFRSIDGDDLKLSSCQ